MRKEYLVICVPRRLPRGRLRHEPFSDPKMKHFTWQASITSPTTREIEDYRVDLSGKSTSHRYSNASRSSSKNRDRAHQESGLRWSPDDGRSLREIVRQQRNFSPPTNSPRPCSRWWFCRARSKCKNSRDITTSRYFGTIHKSAPRG